MTVVFFVPTFIQSDLTDIHAAFARLVACGVAEGWERSRPDDNGADILALVDTDGDAVLSVVRTRDGYASYDRHGQTIGEGRALGTALEPLREGVVLLGRR